MSRSTDFARLVFIQLSVGSGGGYTAYLVVAHTQGEAVRRAKALMALHSGKSMNNVGAMPFDFPRDELKAGTYRLTRL